MASVGLASKPTEERTDSMEMKVAVPTFFCEKSKVNSEKVEER